MTFFVFVVLDAGHFNDVPVRAFVGSRPLPFGARFEINGIAVKR